MTTLDCKGSQVKWLDGPRISSSITIYSRNIWTLFIASTWTLFLQLPSQTSDVIEAIFLYCWVTYHYVVNWNFQTIRWCLWKLQVLESMASEWNKVMINCIRCFKSLYNENARCPSKQTLLCADEIALLDSSLICHVWEPGLRLTHCNKRSFSAVVSFTLFHCLYLKQ